MARPVGEQREDLSFRPAIVYGRKHEEDAFLQFTNRYPHLNVVRNGLFISRDFPFIAASPDAYLPGKAVIEIKCPKTMEKLHPKDIHKLSKAEQRAHCNELVNGEPKIKRDHQYFLQVQHQMFVCGVKMCYFIV